jgi:putative heme-binding domain-containing protein
MRPPLVALFALVCSPALAEDPALVAPTGPRSPADERKALKVPDGFDVQLVASEPDIQKPMQMAFDAKGRIWVTTSYHYPFAAPAGKGTDKLFVLSDFGPDGKAKKVETFAADLNIPIGILPLPDCNGCIVSHVGEILKLTDTDGDGKADQREVLFKGFGTRDTHGMTNSFTLMPDGWVYACHGFANDSKVKGADGHEVVMNSGHTFRFRPDGSRIEVVTRGQVNPFGIAVDPWFNLYTADCHSKPITQVIPGAYYDSFGKPHDGLGYGPHVTKHDHNSTGLCGVAWYDADHFPAEFKGCMFVGNVVTNRINFDRIEWRGSTPVAKELPDFLVSEDRWFRPTDLKLGPDGALYVTDFYNKIIGHYEVDLKHPGRDKDHGRVWRIVWTGKDAKPPRFPRPDFTAATANELLDDLGNPNLTVRFLAGHQLRRRFAAGEPLPADLNGDIVQKWVKRPEQVGAYLAWLAIPSTPVKDKPSFEKTFGRGMLVQVVDEVTDHGRKGPDGHLVRVLSRGGNWDDDGRGLVRQFLEGPVSAHHKRAAVEAIITYPHADYVKPLVELIPTVPADDTHLAHAAKIALRNCLRDAEGGWAEAAALMKDRPERSPGSPRKQYLPVLFPAVLGAKGSSAAAFLTRSDFTPRHLAETGLTEAQYLDAAELIGRYGDWKAREAVIRPGVGTEPGDGQFRPGETLRFTLRTIAAVARGARAADKPTVGHLFEDGKFAIEAGLKQTVNPAVASAAAQALGAILAVPDEPGRDVIMSAVRANLVGPLRWWMTRPGAPVEMRADMFDLAVQHLMDDLAPAIGDVLADGAAPPALREKVALALANNPKALRHAGPADGVRLVMKTAPYRYQAAVALALAGSPPGAEVLFKAVKMTEASPRLLQDRQVLERLKAVGVQNLDAKVAELTKGLPPADQKLAELIRQRAGRVTQVKADPAEGAKVFAKNCAACHRIGDQGGKVAPQLDGIGNRGAERLLEDILDPNRNVDAAFRARVVTLTDGTTKTGLMLRVDGPAVVFADAEGKEFRVPSADIEANRETALSPMPANFGETIPEPEFYHLLAYLLGQKAKELPK